MEILKRRNTNLGGAVGARRPNYISAEEAKWKIRRNSLSLVFHLLVQFPVESVDSTLRLFVVGFYLIALLAQFLHEGVPRSFPLLPSRFAGLGKRIHRSLLVYLPHHPGADLQRKRNDLIFISSLENNQINRSIHQV